MSFIENRACFFDKSVFEQINGISHCVMQENFIFQ